MKLKNLFASDNNSKEEFLFGEEDAVCCGKHEVCEKEEILKAALRKKIEYYDDEELDQYAGRSSDSYSPEEIEIFSEILHTMWESDVSGWIRSLQVRGIELPDELKDEVFLILGSLK